MKKRITALLLCLVMVFSLIPTTVWAAGSTMSWTWTVTIFGGNYYRSDGTVSSTNKYTVNRHLDNSKDNDIGYKFEWNASAGGNAYNGGWELCITVNDSVVERTTAYVYTRNMSTASDSWTARGSSHTGTSSHPFTLSLSSFPEADNCNHDYDWKDNGNGTHTGTCKNCDKKVTEPHVDGNGDGFCDKCDACLHPHHEAGYCTVNGCTHPDSCCPKKPVDPPVDPPVGPGENDTPDKAELLTVECVTADAKHTPKSKQYNIVEQGTVEHPTDTTWTYTVTLNRATYVTKFVEDTETAHTDKAPNDVITLTWNWENGKWTKGFDENPVIKCECKTEIEPPTDGPTDDDVKAALGNVTVTVKCINPGTKHTSCAYGVLGGNDGYQLTKNEDGTYNVVLNAAPFVAAYSKSGQGRGLPHDLYSAKNLTWVLTYEEGKWVANPETSGVDDTILVTHMPEATYDVLKGMQGGIDTRCVNNTTAHHYTNYGVILGVVGDSAQMATVTKGEVSGTYNLTISTKNFADNASKHNDRVHDLLTGETANFVLSLSKNDADKYVWTATPVTPGVDDVCEVAHRVKVTFDQNYTNAPAATEAMYKYDTAEVMEGAFPADPSRSGYVFQGWNTKADGTGDAFSNATAVTKDVTVYAQWGQLHPVQIVIYRNGDTSKAYKTVSLDPQLKGTPIDLTQLKISDYYTGNYEFYGWYNDGKWNEYLKNPDNAPAGLEKITVNGWTNLKCMVYDYETVVYFETEEALKAYQADHSKTEGIMKTTTALHGSTLPTVDAPDTNNRAGYTFQYWSREGQSVDVAGQTVNGWTNLYGNWTITPHNIYAYARLNSYFAPLTAAEFEDTITLNADTLKRLGLGSYNRLGFIPIGTFNFDGMPLVDDMYFDDDTLDAVADAATDAIDNRTIDLDTGVSSSTAAKIDWTVLYKTFNEEDMAPGYITDDGEGYQLSGNLNLATVMFNAGERVNPADVENMPTVNYTYEGFGIHDFYFVGNVFDLPENVPTREGYIFKGWSAAVIPGEDDADCYADPTTDAGAETQTLYKAGDTYTITDGGVIFTAQWEKKTYTIAASLYLNDSASPVMVDSGAYKWTHRYGGEYGDTIDYQPMIDALKARALEADKANKPYDAEITLYFPGSDKVFNTAVTTYGQNTARWQEINGSNIAYIKGVATTSYQVIFKAEDGTEIETKIVEYGKTVASAAPGEKYGYNFVGWVDQDGNAFTFDNDGNSVTEITHKTVLTAQWAKKDYVIASDLRINGGDANLADGKTYAWTYRYGGKFEETIDYQPMLDALKARAMKVDAANCPVDSDITLIVPGSKDKTKFNDVVTYYGQDTANWQAANKNTAYIWGYAVNYYNVTFDYGTEDIKNETLKVKFNDTLTAPKPERDGYTFKGWYTDADCTEGNEFNFTQGVTKTMTLYAGWQVNTYVVTFDSNGGSAVEPQNVDYRAKVTKPAEPTREGYHFMGWFNGDKEWNFDEDTMGAGNMTLTAKWEINKYTVSFDSKGGTKVDSQIVEHGSTATKPRTPRRNDYTFKGWYLDGKKFDFSTPITDDITLVARWTTKTSGGSNSSSDTTTKDNGKTVQSGKTFDGGIALYVGLSVLSATGSALVITKKKRG